MRLFFALEPAPPLKESIAALRAGWRDLLLRASWTDPWKLHLTLAFLGDQEEERLPALGVIGGEVAGRHAPLRLSTSTVGAFPNGRRARVLWLGLERGAALDLLAGDLREAIRREGIALDGKPFAAHLTLARFRTPTDIAPLDRAPAPLIFDAPELVLFRSRLEPKGARYEKIGAYPLSGPSF